MNNVIPRASSVELDKFPIDEKPQSDETLKLNTNEIATSMQRDTG